MRLEETLGLSHILKIADHTTRQKIDVALQQYGLTSAQYSVLSVIEENECLTSAELARLCFVSPQTMNRIMQNLEEAGFVKKSSNPDHALKLDYIFTNKGKKVVCDAHISVNEIEMKMVSGFTKKEIEQLRQALQKCFDNLRLAKKK